MSVFLYRKIIDQHGNKILAKTKNSWLEEQFRILGRNALGRSAHVVYISYLIIIVTVMPPKAPPTHIGCFSIKGPVQLEHQAPPGT